MAWQVFKIGGPMWAHPLHDRAFVESMIALVKSSPGAFGTEKRMLGMLSVAAKELDVPFYYDLVAQQSIAHEDEDEDGDDRQEGNKSKNIYYWAGSERRRLKGSLRRRQIRTRVRLVRLLRACVRVDEWVGG